DYDIGRRIVALRTRLTDIAGGLQKDGGINFGSGSLRKNVVDAIDTTKSLTDRNKSVSDADDKVKSLPGKYGPDQVRRDSIVIFSPRYDFESAGGKVIINGKLRA